MANRTARHQQPGNRNLRGKRTMQVCPCCDPIIDHREKILAGLAEQEMRRAGAARDPLLYPADQFSSAR